MAEYSIDQSAILSSPIALLGKNKPGFISRYAQAADPKSVDLPPPLGPIRAVTGKSKVTAGPRKEVDLDLKPLNALF
jgi:hypothetical protein